MSDVGSFDTTFNAVTTSDAWVFRKVLRQQIWALHNTSSTHPLTSGAHDSEHEHELVANHRKRNF